MRKGRPGAGPGNAGFGRSDSGGPLAGGDPPVDAPFDARADTRTDASADTFDPFESFDAHDRAAGHGPAVPTGPRFGSRRAGDASGAAAAAAATEGETTYTRSRRQPGAADSPSTASQRQRPTRSLKG